MAQDRRAESVTAYEAWKTKKDSIVRKQKTLYTYQKDPRKPPKDSKWCPARSVTHDYPVDDVAAKLSSRAYKNRPSMVERTSVDSYSECSFESDKSLGDSGDSDSKHLSPTGRLKTIDVCCQKLEYWCICRD